MPPHIHSILLTGVSGYLGGSLLAHLTATSTPLPAHSYKTIFALVRTESQASSVRALGATPLTFDISDPKSVRDALVENGITIVLFLIDALRAEKQALFIDALAEVKARIGEGVDVHFVHTSGAKIFSSHAGAPTDRPLLDTEEDLYEIQKAQVPKVEILKSAIDANTSVIEHAESRGVKSYIFVPCIVYGKGLGFGNKISIQTVAIVRAARAVRKAYAVDEGRPTWPVCHIHDTTTLYVSLIQAILAGRNPGSGKAGFYLAASGSVAWRDLYGAMAKRLAERGEIDGPAVVDVAAAGSQKEEEEEETLQKMGAALGCPPELVALQMGGLCTFTARHALESLSWTPRFAADDILTSAGEEVDLILENI